jgi:cytidyltransferase-like protein
MTLPFFGSIIGIRPEYEERYVALHANTFPAVLRRISRSGIRNYSIFMGDGLLFSHMEYAGRNHAADMAAIGTDETTRQWWKLTDPMQQPLEERAAGEWWASLSASVTVENPHGTQPIRRLCFWGPRSTVLPDSLPGVFRLRAFPSRDRLFVYVETHEEHAASALPSELRPMAQVFHTDGLADVPRRKVFVSGCFDMLHSGHVAFLQEAATHGELTVGIGSDATVRALKHRSTVNPQDERRYMIEALACVSRCVVNSGSGILDFEPELRSLKPDVLVVNTDGDSPAKRALCQREGVEYRVLQRVPAGALPARSTTALREACTLPFRIDLAGGWLDQPFVSRHHAGPVLTVSIEPTADFNDRSGMASSTRKKAMELWRTRLPHGDPEHLARVLFSFENPPGTKEVAGSQDALGLVLPGLNRLHYQGGYWPTRMDHVHDEAVLSFLEDHLQLATLGPRGNDYSVLADTRVDESGARALAQAAEDCWTAVLARDAVAFGRAFTRSFEAQVAMFPRMVDNDIRRTLAQHAEGSLGWKISGAGGGGYLILVRRDPLPGTTRIRIRRASA